MVGLSLSDQQAGLINKRARGGEGGYRMMSTTANCSGVVMTALAEGGAGASAAPPKSRVYTLPNEVAAYAQKVRDEVLDLNRRVGPLRDGIESAAKAGGPWPRFPGRELPAGGEFKRQSEDGLNGLARGRGRRPAELRAVDRALDRYHRHNWGPASYPKRYAALVGVVRGCLTYFEQHPGGSRLRAVLGLAERALEQNRLVARRFSPSRRAA